MPHEKSGAPLARNTERSREYKVYSPCLIVGTVILSNFETSMEGVLSILRPRQFTFQLLDDRTARAMRLIARCYQVPQHIAQTSQLY